MAFSLSDFQKGVFSLIGSCLIHLVLGSFYLWGTINIYVCSYYKLNYDHNLTLEMASICFPILCLASNTCIPFSVKICEKIGLRLHCLTIGVFMSVCVFSSSFANGFWYYVILFGVCFGVGIGMLYVVPIYNAYKYFPNRKGLVGGIIMCSYGIGTIIAINVALFLINPDNEKTASDGYFDKNIADRIPNAIRTFSYYFISLIVVGSLFLFEFPHNSQTLALPKPIVNDIPSETTDSENNNKQPLLRSSIKNKELEKKQQPSVTQVANPQAKEVIACNSLLDAMKHPVLYSLMIMAYCSHTSGFFIAANYKDYGLRVIDDDYFITTVGSVSMVFSAVGRISWGAVLDKTNFKLCYTMLLLGQIILMATLQFVSISKAGFLIWVCLLLFCQGGQFVIIPPVIMKLFGLKIGSLVYSIIMVVAGISNATQFGINESSLDYEKEFWIYVAFSAFALMTLILSHFTFLKKI